MNRRRKCNKLFWREGDVPLVKLDYFGQRMWLMGGHKQWKWQRRKLWLSVGSMHVCRAAYSMSGRRKCSISYSTNEPFQMGPDKNALQLFVIWKQEDREQIAEPQVLLFWLCLHTTFNPCAWYANSNTAHIKLCSQACLDAVPVNCHDDFAPWPSANDTLHQAGPAGYDAPLYSPVSQSLRVQLIALTSSVLSGICLSCSFHTKILDLFGRWLLSKIT